MPSPVTPVTGGPVRAIGYIRVSTGREEMISPALQRASINAEARRRGHVVIGWAEDLDDTGRNFRRKVMNAIGRVEAGDASVIIVYNYSRWGRNMAGALANIQRLELVGGSLISATELLDPETTFGRFSRSQALLLAELQSDMIGDSWKGALSSRVEAGLPATGFPRFGYIRTGRIPDPFKRSHFHRDPAVPEVYVPDPVTGPVLAELYERYAGGQGATRLLRWINPAGIRTVRGGMWGVKTLMGVLDSGFAAGLLRAHDKSCRCGQPTTCKNAVFLPGTQEPLITGEQWEAYCKRRDANRRLPPRSRDPAYPLTGLMRCGTCKGIMIAAYGYGQRGYAYRCNNWVQHKGCTGSYVRRSLAEAAVLAELAKLAGEAGARASAVTARARVVADAEQARARLTADLAAADRKLRRLVLRAASDVGVPESVWEEAKAELLAGRAHAEAALAAAGEASEANRGEFLPVARDLLASWDLIPVPRRRNMLATVIARVEVTRTGSRKPARIDVIPVWEETAGQPL